MNSPVRRSTTGGSHPLQAPAGLWEVQLLPGPEQEVAPGVAGLQELALQVGGGLPGVRAMWPQL